MDSVVENMEDLLQTDNTVMDETEPTSEEISLQVLPQMYEDSLESYHQDMKLMLSLEVGDISLDLLESFKDIIDSVMRAIAKLIQSVQTFLMTIALFFKKINIEQRISKLSKDWNRVLQKFQTDKNVTVEKREELSQISFSNPDILDVISKYITKEYKEKEKGIDLYFWKSRDFDSETTVHAAQDPKKVDFGELKTKIVREIEKNRVKYVKAYELMRDKLNHESLTFYTKSLREIVDEGKKIIDGLNRERNSSNKRTNNGVQRAKDSRKFRLIYRNLNDVTMLAMRGAHLYVNTVNKLYRILMIMEKEVKE